MYIVLSLIRCCVDGYDDAIVVVVYVVIDIVAIGVVVVVSFATWYVDAVGCVADDVVDDGIGGVVVVGVVVVGGVCCGIVDIAVFLVEIVVCVM